MNIKITTEVNEINAVTHSGIFHADEVFSTVILSKIMDVRLVRVFDTTPYENNNGVIVYDIGKGKYDHHQLSAKVRPDGIKYAACGLIWRDFGRKVLSKMGCDENLIEDTWKFIDHRFIRAIDAFDNGIIPECPFINAAPFISMMNPVWNEDKDSDEAFLEACEFAEKIFNMIVKSETSKAMAKGHVEEALSKVNGSHVMILDRYVPWTEHLFSIPDTDDVWYVVFPSNRGGYNVQCVPVSLGSFEQRAPLPKEWKGNAKKTGIKTCTFVHASGFLAACTERDDAIKFAEEAVKRHMEEN